MGKKKFIDKKKAATFQLLARDSSDPHYNQTPGSDRLFVRVDNNQCSSSSFFGDDGSCPIDEDPNSKFADADEDDGEYDFGGNVGTSVTFGRGFGEPAGETSLPEDVRREILELGFPDDGYNYLIHLREIRGTGGGSNYYANPKAKLDELPHDVKAYDASRVHVSTADNVDMDDKSMYRLASKAVGVKVQKVFDPEVAAFLDDSDLSRFGSDVEDLEEDFVARANQLEERGYVDTHGDTDLMNGSKVINLMSSGTSISECPETDVHCVHVSEEEGRFTKKAGNDIINQTKRCPRALDEQFDLLVREEYGTDDEEDEYGRYNSDEDESLAAKLKHAFGDHNINDLGLDEEYKAPSDFLNGKERPKTTEELEAAADIVRRCAEYAKKYENEDESEDDVIVQESSDESEEWDCETIVSTYSNLDNHPGKIETPGTARRKKLSATVAGALNASGPVISLRGREKCPVDFLPRGRKFNIEKPKSMPSATLEQPKRKQHGQESKEEKKERKASVKEERREARRLKKELKGLYRGEAQRAQRVAAVSGPSLIHLM